MLLNVGFIPLTMLSQYISALLVYCPNGYSTLMQRHTADIRTELYLFLFEIINWDTSTQYTVQDKLSTIEIIGAP